LIRALANAGNNSGDAVLGQYIGENASSISKLDRDELDAEKRALRVLLDSFHTEPETLLEQTIESPTTRRSIGKFIAFTLVKPSAGEH
jgi:hypothetical protein